METTPRRFRERIDGQLLSRVFICGTEHVLSVALGRDADPPIQGSVGNQRTEVITTYGETTCREYQVVSDTGERICLAWNWGEKTERRTVGSTARWYLVPDSLVPGPLRNELRGSFFR